MDARTHMDRLHAVDRLASSDASLFADPAIAAERLGWIGLPADAAAQAPSLREVAADVVAAGVTDVVLLGMGGSSLAPLVLSRAIDVAPGNPVLHVVDTTSPEHVDRLLRGLRPASTFVLVSSKSGTTVEPRSLAEVFRAWLRADLGDGAERHMAAVTDPGSELAALASSEGFSRVFLAPPDVGGRYAALTPFATVPGSLVGVDTGRLAAAGQAAEAACRTPGDTNPGEALAAWLSDAYDAGRDKLTIVCSPPLASFGLWVEQLVAESTGKGGRGLLPVLEQAPGLPSAHGPDRMTFVLRTPEDAELASLPSRLPAGEPSFESVLDDAYLLGGEAVRWEWAIALFSVLQGIEPFDQPDVEEAKATTAAILSGDRAAPESTLRDGDLTITSNTDGAAPHDMRSALEALFANAAAPSYLAVLAYLPEDDAVLAPLRDACDAVAATLRIAVTLELGPRYLHSTGQYHKGGPATGRFLVVTADDRVDLDIPGRPFTLAQLHRAQPAGDVATLMSRGRPVVAVRLPAADEAHVRTLADAVRAALVG